MSVSALDRANVQWMYLLDRVEGKAGPGQKRDPRWPATRRAYLAEHPDCECCEREGPRGMSVHHLIPFWVAPTLELDPGNLQTYCSVCHLLIGHLRNYRTFNPSARSMAAMIRLARREHGV